VTPPFNLTLLRQRCVAADRHDVYAGSVFDAGSGTAIVPFKRNAPTVSHHKPICRTERKSARWQIALATFFARPAVEIFVGGLVIVSVFLTLVDFAFYTRDATYENAPLLTEVIRLNDFITWVFCVELTLRFLAARSKRGFFREFWIDILALLPLFRVFRAGRALRLLRLFRILRVFGVVTRIASRFPEIVRRGAIEYVVTIGVLVFTVMFGAGALLHFERGSTHRHSILADGQSQEGQQQEFDAPLDELDEAFWFSLFSLFAGEPIPASPQTLGGKMVAVFVMFMGVTIFAMFTGTVSAFMVERIRTEGSFVSWEELHDHIIICGYNSRADVVIQEYLSLPQGGRSAVVLIADRENEASLLGESLRGKVHYLDDDFTRVASLEKAGVHRAKTCIILTDTRSGRSLQDADARTILAALTVEKLNPAIYTCAELHNRDYGTHLEMGHVDDYVVSGEYGAYLLAHAAMKRGLVSVCTELITTRKGNEFFRVAIPESWVGRGFSELLLHLKQCHRAILVAVHPLDEEAIVNPDDYTFQPGDDIVAISKTNFEISPPA